MTPKPKTPRTPPAQLVRVEDDVVGCPETLWRVHRGEGPHVLPWNGFRTFGPLPTMRWDPHPGDEPAPSTVGVLYCAGDIATCLAEVFQLTRSVDSHSGAPVLSAWQPLRPLRLLDLTETWPVRNGASATLLTAPRSVCRRWARAIRCIWPDLDGLRVRSTLTGRDAVVLWQPAVDSMPELPLFSRPLAAPLVWSMARISAREIGYQML